MIGTKLAHCGTTSHIESRGIGVPLVQPANVGGILWRMFWNRPVLAFSAFLIMTNLLLGADALPGSDELSDILETILRLFKRRLWARLSIIFEILVRQHDNLRLPG